MILISSNYVKCSHEYDNSLSFGLTFFPQLNTEQRMDILFKYKVVRSFP